MSLTGAFITGVPQPTRPPNLPWLSRLNLARTRWAIGGPFANSAGLWLPQVLVKARQKTARATVAQGAPLQFRWAVPPGSLRAFTDSEECFVCIGIAPAAIGPDRCRRRRRHHRRHSRNRPPRNVQPRSAASGAAGSSHGGAAGRGDGKAGPGARLQSGLAGQPVIRAPHTHRAALAPQRALPHRCGGRHGVRCAEARGSSSGPSCRASQAGSGSCSVLGALPAAPPAARCRPNRRRNRCLPPAPTSAMRCCAGKTTVCDLIVQRLQEQSVVMLAQVRCCRGCRGCLCTALALAGGRMLPWSAPLCHPGCYPPATLRTRSTRA